MEGGTARVGVGFDAHRLALGRRLVLGGVRVPSRLGLAGHSDGDVLCHAVVDAILGALGAGDIGTHFPSDEPRWKDASSLGFLGYAAGLVAGRGGEIANVDATLILEAPRVARFVGGMRSRVAKALEIPAARVGIKATTTDGLGFAGRGEGAAAIAVALLRLPAGRPGKLR
ncbi:MAG: 2-C-methyl-D-erythritol 2,4-cyclodiphosphate synthase [Acidobacteria bacterium]|nr:2-C-methyl-D-erythritol 2,4-cyclodiphosphate synthase [Acidobacteriota bacterium]